jgi:methionyl-tRNA formyltransferase
MLSALLDTAHRVVAVYTQPDRPAGRGRKTRSSPTKLLAEAHGLAVQQPQTLRTPWAQQTLAGLAPDVMVVAAYGLLLPKPVLNIPRLGCINVHASLLPRWRGAAPIVWAIVAGDPETGISIMQMNERLDAGPVLRMAHCHIGARETAQSLHDRLAALGATLLVETLDDLQLDSATATPQDEVQATYAPRINKRDALLDWRRAADLLERQVRAFYPQPIAWTVRHGQPLRVYEARLLAERADARPGTVVACAKEGIDVVAGQGGLRLVKLQRPGGRPVSAAEYINAHPIAAGEVLGASITAAARD